MAALLAFAFVLGACGSPSPSSFDSRDADGTPDVTVNRETIDMSFRPDVITVETSQLVAFVISNPDRLKHDFRIDDLNGHSAHVEVSPRQEVTIQIRMPDAPGEWRFYCSIPGHESLGMDGVLRVE